MTDCTSLVPGAAEARLLTRLQYDNTVRDLLGDMSVPERNFPEENLLLGFGNVGRRTQNLVGRQLAMIDSLERNEQDPVLLDRLYRLDHVSTRLRRNANSLVVLSGAVDPEMTGEPMSVADAMGP